jgi:DNA-binding NtrC family response regulator
MPRKAGPKVFVVYEDNLIGTTLVAFLERNGYRATAFTSPLNALEAARSDAPDILVADVLLPDLSGVKLAVLMANRVPWCRILLFSGAASPEAWHEVAQERSHDFRLLLKPIHPKVLLAELVQLVNKPPA